MLLYSSIFIIIIGISLFLLAVVLALTVFVAIKKYEHYKHRRLSRKHRRRHVVKVKGEKGKKVKGGKSKREGKDLFYRGK